MQAYFPKAKNNFNIFNKIASSNFFEDAKIFENSKFEDSSSHKAYSTEDDECSLSQTPLSKDQDFDVKCLNFEANCNWKGKIFDLLGHLAKDCPGKVVYYSLVNFKFNFKEKDYEKGRKEGSQERE